VGSSTGPAGSTTTGVGGNYHIGGLSPGSYTVMFDNGDYVIQWYNNKTWWQSPDQVTLSTAATVQVDAVLIPAGHISGTVTKVGGGPLAGISVGAYTRNASGAWQWCESVPTAADGTYELDCLAAGSYRVEFSDDSGVYATQFYYERGTPGTPDEVTVIAGVTTSGIDDHLIPPPTISSFAPSSDVQGSTVTLTGTNLWSVYKVTFNGTAASYLAISDTQITATVPSGATSGPISITTPFGTVTSTASFTVDNTPAGNDQMVALPAGVTLTFASVSASGLTTVTTSTIDPGTTPAPFRVLGGSFYQIATSASYSGPVSVALPYDPTGLTLAQQQALAIMHLDNGVWTNVTDYVDTAAHVIVGTVPHLSWFALAVDSTPPTSTCNITKTWYDADVPVVLSATDAGSGVATIQYKLSSARSWASASPNAQGQVSFTVGGEGRFTLLFRAIDAAGNLEAQHSVSFGIDRHRSLTLVDYFGGWSRAPVTLHFIALDLLSGVAATQSSIDNGASWKTGTSRTISTEGQTTVLYRSLDNAGNLESAHRVVVKIDATSPVICITSPTAGATYLLGQVVKASWSASDAFSGLAWIHATAANGTAIATSQVTRVDPKTGKPVGLFFTVIASDAAGNTTTKTVTYFVTHKPRAGFLAPIDANGAGLFELRAPP